jgi:hypothetical protein
MLLYTAEGTSDLDDIEWSITGGADMRSFVINAAGELRFAGTVNAAALDQDVDNPKSSYEVTLTATSGALTDTQRVTVTVTNVNDNPPVLRRIPGQQAVLNEGTFSSATETGYRFIASDADTGTSSLSVSGDPRDRFELMGVPISFGVVGGPLQIKAGSVFNYDNPADRTIVLTITATDTGVGTGNPPSATTKRMVTINIGNVNNHSPVITPTSSQVALVERRFDSDTDTGYSFTASDDDGGTAVLSVSGDPRFKLVDGVLQIKAGEVFNYDTLADRAIVLTITAADSGKGSGDPPDDTTRMVTIMLTPNSPHYASTIVRKATDSSVAAISGTEESDLIINFKSTESSNILVSGGDGDDFIVNADGDVRGDSTFAAVGDDIIIHTSDKPSRLRGDNGNDAIFSVGGSIGLSNAMEFISGGTGNDIIVSGVALFTAELAALKRDVDGDVITQSDTETRIPFIPQIDVFNLPEPELHDGKTIRGGYGNDLIIAAARAPIVATEQMELFEISRNDVQDALGGDDFIIAFSNSDIYGGPGDDLLWLRPYEAGDVFIVSGFGDENVDAEDMIGDRFLIVLDETAKANLGDAPTVEAILAAAGWVVQTSQDIDNDGRDDDIRITVTTTIDNVPNQQYTIELENYNTALTVDDFLILTEVETREYIRDFDAGPDGIDFFPLAPIPDPDPEMM